MKSKIPMSWNEVSTWRQVLKNDGKTLVFTNGVFDILHAGHVEILEKARSFGDVLILGLNSDESVRRIKGPNRPIKDELNRSAVLLAMSAVDAVVLFSEDTPEKLLEVVVPDVLVKGGDYTIDEVVGREIVESKGGRIEIVPLLEAPSTSSLVESVLERHGLDKTADREHFTGNLGSKHRE